MLTSKQRAYLRGLGNQMDTIIHIGKGGISLELVKQADDALEARELVKAGLLETAPEEVRETAADLARQTGSEVVQVIGRRFILYRAKKKNPVIQLPKGR